MTPRFTKSQDIKNEEVTVHYDRDPSKVKWLFMPENKYKNTWDMFIIVLLLYVAVVVPYRVCLIDDSSEFMLWLDCFMDGSFTIDIILTFFTAIKIKDVIVTRRAHIAKTYIKGWFFLDLITTIPFQLIEGTED